MRALLLVGHCAVLFVLSSAFGFESLSELEDTSLLQVVVERNWGRGKARSVADDMADDLSLMQTQVVSETRIQPSHHMIAGVSPDGDVGMVEEPRGSHHHRPQLVVDDAFSLMQTAATVQRGLVASAEAPGVDLYAEVGTEVSLLQTGFQQTRRDVVEGLQDITDPKASAEAARLDEASWVSRTHQATKAVLLSSPVDAIVAVKRKADIASVPSAPLRVFVLATIGFHKLFDKLTTLEPWQLREWALFAMCILVLQFVVWSAASTRKRKTKGFRSSWRGQMLPPETPNSVPPRRLTLTFSARELLDRSGSGTKLFRSPGLCQAAFSANISEDRTVQIYGATEPSQALMSVGPLPVVGSEDGSLVYRFSTGCTLGALQADGHDSWRLTRNGQTYLTVKFSEPHNIAVSVGGREVAWLRPLCAYNRDSHVELSVSDGGDIVLPVACCIAALAASSSSSSSSSSDRS